MATVLAVMSAVGTIASTGLSVMGSMNEAKQAKKNAARQQQYYQDKAKADLAKGTYEAKNQWDQARLAISRNTAVAAASGTAASYGDPVRLSGEIAEKASSNVQATLYNTDLAISEANYGSQEAALAGQRSYQSSMMKAGGTALSGASKLFSYGDWGIGGGSGGGYDDPLNPGLTYNNA